MVSKTGEKNFFLILLFIVIAITAIIFFPFLTVLVLGASFAVVLDPLHHFLMKHVIKSNWISAILSVLIFILVLVGPLVLVGSLVATEINNLLVNGITPGPFIQTTEHAINNFLPQNFHVDGQALLDQAVTYISQNIGHFFTSTLNILFSFVLMILSIFYFLKDGSNWRRSIVSFSPLSDENDMIIINHLRRSINGVIKGYILIGAIQGTLMGIGLAIFGVQNAALWGLVAAIASLVPTIGTSLVSVPIILLLFSTGHTSEAIGMTIWATALVGSIDNFLNPVIVSQKVSVSPLFILFSVLGGIALMGPVGILIGPIVMSLLYSLLSIYKTILYKK